MQQRVFTVRRRDSTNMGCMSILVYFMLTMGLIAVVFLLKMFSEGDLDFSEHPEALIVFPLVGGAFYQAFFSKAKKQMFGNYVLSEAGFKFDQVQFLWENLILSEYQDVNGNFMLYTLRDRNHLLWIISSSRDEMFKALKDYPLEYTLYTEAERYYVKRNSSQYKIVARSQDHRLRYDLYKGNYSLGKFNSEEQEKHQPRYYLADPEVKELVRR